MLKFGFPLLYAAGAMALSACQTLPSPANSSSDYANHHMIAAANPLAAKAGREILRAGGSAVDALISTQMVLTLVEPQSSGIGGGAFLMHYNKSSDAIDSYDGRETAPMSATPGMFLKANGKPKKFYDAVVGGSSVGVPGLLRALEHAHNDHGKLPWADLFKTAIRLAESGFTVSPRLARSLAREKHLKSIPASKNYFYTARGTPRQAGELLKNQKLAETLRAIAEKGANAFYTGSIAKSIVLAVSRAAQNPGGMNLADLARYKTIKREPVCLDYRSWKVCGMGPPSSGGLTTLQILGILNHFNLSDLPPMSTPALHLILEASRLAFADRNTYIADPDFIALPKGLIDPAYLALRAEKISPLKAAKKRRPGMPGLSKALIYAPDGTEKGLSTTHISIIDKDGNAVSMTSSIESTFGSRLMASGFLLNNQLTDFSFRPSKKGIPVANRAEPGKRARSSMSPTLVFDKSGNLVMTVGSPGGSRIIGFVVKTLIATLDWGMDMDTAIDSPNFVNRNGKTELEKGTALEALKSELEAMGHKVRLSKRVSGLHGIRVTGYGLEGGADKRREGVAIGD